MDSEHVFCSVICGLIGDHIYILDMNSTKYQRLTNLPILTSCEALADSLYCQLSFLTSMWPWLLLENGGWQDQNEE